MNEIAKALWSDLGPDDYSDSRASYQNAIIEQYKLYVEMTDRVSGRRATTNTFFITLNTVFLTIIGANMTHLISATQPIWLIFSLLAVLSECGAWFYLIKSYRQLNSAKYRVIGELEKRLPASPFVGGEWHAALNRSERRADYWRLPRLEQIIPILFVVIYVLCYILILFS